MVNISAGVVAESGKWIDKVCDKANQSLARRKKPSK